jgi:two-component system chemotaxis response regulator CheB
MNRKIRVLIVEDSAVVREHLRRILTSDPQFEVAGMAGSGEQALEIIEGLAPDIVTMDIRLPGMQGFEATRRIMALRPTPIVIVSGVDSPDVDLTMEALRAGALSVVEKPVASNDVAYDAMAARLRTQLAIMSDVKVVRQRASVDQHPRRAGSGDCSNFGASRYRILAIGASTGGPNALVQLLSGLGPEFPLPIALVQHITPGFTAGFADWLSKATPFRVRIVQRETPVSSAEVYVCESTFHLVLKGAFVAPEPAPPVRGHRPSADALFSSVARSYASSAIGVLLTGMGEDGAAGLGEMKSAGGFTLAESEATAVVYGMPAAAVKAGAVCESRPLNEIAARVLELTAGKTEVV